MLTAKDLINWGYFPVEVPPPFQTNDLAEKMNLLPLSELERSIKQWTKKSKKNIPGSKSCLFSVPRVKNLRRNLTIPNPFYQLMLCYYIEKNWDKIKDHVKKSPISISRPCFPIIRDKQKRSFDVVKDKVNFEQEIALRSTQFRHMLRADISRYYDTIYTHSIAWALHGKAIAKRERNNRSLFGNDLDRCLRGTRDGQTIGIPMGTGFFCDIAETIATAVDIELEKQLNEPLKGIRIIDDYFLFFKIYM